MRVIPVRVRRVPQSWLHRNVVLIFPIVDEKIPLQTLMEKLKDYTGEWKSYKMRFGLSTLTFYSH